ncbi:MAG: 50S ribosomal protein L4 [Tenericutes bacterium]|nr:50S ribosomal protein L4 [Mycoplasmatota bacterium]
MEKLKDIKLNKELLNIEPNEKVLYDAIILQRASLRQGTHSTKTRSEVSGGGRKPWRQKGTGHARQGSIRAVQWVGGGRYGTPVPRDYSKKQNRKERRLALQTAFLNLYNNKGLVVVDEIKVATPKTKEMVNMLNSLELMNKKVLIVVNELEENLILASRNLLNIALIEANELNVLDLSYADVVLTTKEGLKSIEEVLK